MDALIALGQVFRGEDGHDRPESILRLANEYQRWQRCSSALKLLKDARRKAWSDIRVHKENDAITSVVQARCDSRIRNITLDWINKDLLQLDTASDAIRTSMQGLVADQWIDEYLYTRILPLRTEHDRIQRS